LLENNIAQRHPAMHPLAATAAQPLNDRH